MGHAYHVDSSRHSLRLVAGTLDTSAPCIVIRCIQVSLDDLSSDQLGSSER
jgi:hypothetical protein